ncbi:hypothetical protein QBC37DRAFT_46884 [Rhypophila decipiens]|uniref:Uncharacterized protein n=1 Tax=Rhypophila decipiens TaxID=261697 RepID=A0AAN6YF82_9PEZI|nr:hypothetical protein QBC37DRAFT_46884 [Rhypophila decipiens]
MSFNIALAALFAKFTPILLSQIPFSNSVTWKIHEVCTWMTVAFLGHMVLVLVVDVWRTCRLRRVFRTGREIHGQGTGTEIELLVRMDTIAGCLYYLFESRMVREFEGLSMVKSKRERDSLVEGMGRWYCLRTESDDENGRIPPWEGGGEGAKRVRVDYA